MKRTGYCSLIGFGRKRADLRRLFQSVNEGEMIEAYGRYTEYISYGQQFKIDRYEIKAPETAAAMERYLLPGL